MLFLAIYRRRDSGEAYGLLVEADSPIRAVVEALLKADEDNGLMRVTDYHQPKTQSPLCPN